MMIHLMFANWYSIKYGHKETTNTVSLKDLIELRLR